MYGWRGRNYYAKCPRCGVIQRIDIDVVRVWRCGRCGNREGVDGEGLGFMYFRYAGDGYVMCTRCYVVYCDTGSNDEGKEEILVKLAPREIREEADRIFSKWFSVSEIVVKE